MSNIGKFLLLIIVFYNFFNTNAFSQAFDLGSWNIVNYKYQINDHWSAFGEAQIRSLKFYRQFHYYEYKAGINYQVKPGFVVTLGAGDYDTYAEGGNFVVPKNNDEFRLWPQFLLVQKAGIFKIEHRYRAEMRFTSNGYRNRFRYRLGLQFPLLNNAEGESVIKMLVANEIFFTDREPYFERNRIMLGFNYEYSDQVTFLLGYLHQFDYRINDETGRDFLQTGIYIEGWSRKFTRTEKQDSFKDD